MPIVPLAAAWFDANFKATDLTARRVGRRVMLGLIGLVWLARPPFSAAGPGH